MKRIKDLRSSSGYTQKALAEMLQTTQQTIARWETGVAEPSLKSLKDLALIFGVSVDDLLGTNPINREPQAAVHYILQSARNDGYWGNVGVALPGYAKTKWFPITQDTYRRIRSFLSIREFEEEDGWLAIQTLNNRMLVLQPHSVKRLWLLDEACDSIEGDWEVDWDEVEGAPLELYRQLDDYFSDFDGASEEVSDALIATVEDVVKKQGLTDENIYEFLHYTHINFKDGSSTSYWVEDRHLWDLVARVDMGATPQIFNLEACGGDFESYIPAEQVLLINMPLIDVIDAAKRDEE